MLGLVDILFAFAYDQRVNEGDSNVSDTQRQSAHSMSFAMTFTASLPFLQTLFAVFPGGIAVDHLQTQWHTFLAGSMSYSFVDPCNRTRERRIRNENARHWQTCC